MPALGGKGFQVQAYYRILHLVKRHRVHVVCYGEGTLDKSREQALLNIGVSVEMLPWAVHEAALEFLKRLFSGALPLQCAIFSLASFRSVVESCITKYSIDVVHSTTIRVAPCAPDTRPLLILDLVDSMSLNFTRRVERAPWWQKYVWQFELERVAKYERQLAETAPLGFVVSALDRDEIRVPSIHVLPLGIDTDRYSPSREPTSPIVVFSGNMGYRPNEEAVLWLARECWPEVCDEFPAARLVIAGNRPSKEVENLKKEESIRVTGYVESMVEVLRAAQVAVAPMQSGSGMQFKILEAMACGIPVITTTLGLGDIKANVNKEIFVADSPKQFSESILALLRSRDLRNSVGKSGRQYIQRNHSWHRINHKFESLAEEAFLNANSSRL